MKRPSALLLLLLLTLAACLSAPLPPTKAALPEPGEVSPRRTH